MINGTELDLGGKKYTVPPLSLGALEDLGERLKRFTGGADKESVSTVIDALFAALSRNYPNITREEVREMVGLENMHEAMAAVMNVSGFQSKDAAEGEAQAPTSP